MTSELRIALVACIALLGCSSHVEGISVELAVMHHAGDDPALRDIRYEDGELRGFATDEGFGIVLYQARIVITSATLLRCEDDGVGATLRALFSPVSTAHAHATLGIRPHVIDLGAADRTTRIVARIAPAPGRYCGLRLQAAPAEDDTEGLPEQPDMLGYSLRVDGAFVGPEERMMHPLALRTTRDEVVDLPLVDAAFAPVALELSEASPVGELRVDLGYYRLLDGIDLANDPAEVQSVTALRNLLDGARAVSL